MKKPVFRSNPEAIIQNSVIDFMRDLGWLVKPTIGTAYSFGWPDLYTFHPGHGQRWIDIKLPKGSVLTKAQCQTWPEWERYKLGVWIMTSTDDYPLLFNPPNWRLWWKPRYEEYTRSIEDILNKEQL